MMDSLKESNFQTMDSTHHLLAGFKAMITDETTKMIEVARMACGGARMLGNSAVAARVPSTSRMR